MITIDEHLTAAPADVCFEVGADVENWPRILPHYRWVRFQRKDGFAAGRVEMSAWREFAGPLRWPTWWVSEMTCDRAVPVVRYRHVEGITTRMDVIWEFHARPSGTLIRIVHEWDGPHWPLIGRFAANHVIGPRFVSFIAGRTLAGVAAEAERRAATKETAR
ncbi:MAG TPA: SRPBCC family protein [Thermoanaerobaculia bacterium]